MTYGLVESAGLVFLDEINPALGLNFKNGKTGILYLSNDSDLRWSIVNEKLK